MKKRTMVFMVIFALVLSMMIAEATVCRKINLGHTSHGMITDEVQRAIGKPDHSEYFRSIWR